MTSPVNGAGPVGFTSASSAVDRPDQMGKEVFLKLLVAQMRYQDPSKPVDSSQMMAQTATFTQVEKLEQLATQNAALLVLQEASTAGALVGRTVTYQDANGMSQTGVVTKTKLNGDSEPTLVVGNTDVQLSKVTEVQQTSDSDTSKEA